MQRLRLLTFTSLAVLSSCKPPDAALRVNVTVRAAGTARVRADCLRITISDETQELKSLTVRRPADDDAVFGVVRGSDLPATVKVQASGYIGSNCSDDSTLKLNAQGEVVTGVFPESGVTELSVFVDPPNSTLDSDRDGYVAAAKGGLDCKDDDNTIFPGAGQICANTVDTDCDGAGGCDDTECGSAVVCADPPDRVRITTTIATMLRYECRGPFRVELFNANGVRKAIRNTAVALSASLPGTTVHGTASCSDAPVASLPIPYDSSFFEVYLKADGAAFGITTLTATADQVPTPGTSMVEVHPQPIDHLDFTSPPRTVSAGACGAEAVTLEFRDAQNRRTDVDAPTTLNLSSAPGDLSNANIFFSDTGCTTDGSMQQLMAGQGMISVYLLARRAGSFTLTSTPSAGTGSTQPLTVQSAVPSQLAFTNGPLVLSTTQSCSAGLFTVQLQDRFDNPVNAPANVAVRLSVSTLVGVTLYEPTGGCMDAPQTDFTILAGTNSVSLRAKGMTAPPSMGEIRANALTGGGTIADGVQVLRISAGIASKFDMTGSAQSPLASVCSANPFTVSLLDSASNPASNPTPITFTLATNAPADPSFHFYSGNGCQTDLNNTLIVPAGQTSATFYYRGNRAVASFTISGSSVLTAPSTFLPGNSIRPGPPGKLVFTAPLMQTAQAGSCTPSPYLANVLDLFDNPTSFTAAQTVTVTSNPAGVTVGSSACNTGNSVLLAAAAPQVSFTAQHTVTNTYGLTATVNGFSTPMPANMTVTPGPSTLIVDTPVGATSTLMAGGCQQITLSRRDMYNNNAPTSGATPVTLQFPASTNWLVYASNNCSGASGASIAMNSTHTVTFSVSPRSSGSHQMTASINSGGVQTAVVNFTVSAGAPTLVFTTPNTGTPGVGTAAASAVAGTCMPITVARKDAFNNDVPLPAAGNMTFTVVAGTTIHSAATCLPGNAITTIPLTTTDSGASFWVYATKSLASGGPQLQNVVISLAAQTANLALTVSPQASTVSTVITLPVGATANLLAHQCQRVNVERRDGFMNLVPAVGSNLTVTPTAAGDMQTFTSVDCTGAANTAIPVTAGASTRDFSIRFDVAGVAARAETVTVETVSAPLSLTISPAATAVFQVLGLPATMVSGACVGPLTLRRKDAYGLSGAGNDTTSGTISVPLTSSQFQFSSATDCSGATTGGSVAINDLSSVSAPFYVTATIAGSATLTATLGAASGMGSLMVNAAPPSEMIFTTPVRTFTASVCGGAGNVITVQLRDPAGNPSNATGGGQAFTAVSSSGGGSWYTNNTCLAAAGGGNFNIPAGVNNLSIFYRDTVVGSPSISLTNGSGLNNPTAQVHSVVAGPAARLAFTTPVRTTFTAAQCPGAGNVITVQLQDANGNPVNAGAAGQTFTAVSNSAGPVSWFTDAACATPSASGVFTIPNGSNSVNVFYQDARAGTPTITLTTGLTPPTGQQHTVNVGPPAKLAFTSALQSIPALTCSGPTVITLQDAGGNVVNAGSNRQITMSATPGASNTTFWSNSGCTTPLASDQITMGSGNSTVTIYFKTENTGALNLFADSPSINQGTQGATLTAPPASSLSFVTAAVSPEAGFCQLVTIERRDSLGRQTTIASPTTITPSFAPSTGMALFANAACTTPIVTTFDILSGAATATVYVKGSSGSIAGNVPGTLASTFTATSGSMTDAVIITVQPMVRRRSAACAIANNGTSIACPITPTLADITRTILFFQATPDNGDTAGDDNVSCRLSPNGGVAEVVCDRIGTNNAVSIEWQTVSFPYSYANGGVSVQHVTGGCTASQASAMPLNITLPQSVTMANSFVLFSHKTSGADNDNEHFFTGMLTGTTTTNNLRFFQASSSTTCTRTVDFDAQVVSWVGTTVARGTTTTGATTATMTATQNTLGSTFLLYSSRMATADTGSGNICRRRMRGEITSGTTFTFTRGCATADMQDVAWEQVRLPGSASVQQLTGTTSNNTATVAVNPTTVDLTRSFAFLGGMGPGGTASGNTNYSANDRLGAAVARAVMTNATTLTFTRTSNDMVGAFTGYVVQLTP